MEINYGRDNIIAWLVKYKEMHLIKLIYSLTSDIKETDSSSKSAEKKDFGKCQQ